MKKFVEESIDEFFVKDCGQTEGNRLYLTGINADDFSGNDSLLQKPGMW